MTARSTLPSNNNQEYGLIFLVIFGMLCFLIWIYQPPIMHGCCWFLYHLWLLCDFPRVHSYIAERMNLLVWASNRVNDLSWREFTSVMNRTAGILMVPLVVIVVGGMIVVRNHPRNRTRRAIDIYTLPHIMAQFSPNIIPALCYGDKRTQLLNCDPPEHRGAQCPDEFALQHQLIIGQRLDRDRAKMVFSRQLGKPLKDMASFNAHERALFAVFGLQVFCNDRKAAEKLLDDLNRSCLIKSRRDKAKIGYPVLRLANGAFHRVSQQAKATLWLRRYSTTRTALSALHDQDLRLPGARFRWLKGLDRTLWYALTSSGRPKVFIEGAGVIAAANWETLIAEVSERLKLPITAPANRMDKAIDGLDADLRDLDLVISPRTLVPQAQSNENETTADRDSENNTAILHTAPTYSSALENHYPEQNSQPVKTVSRAPFRPKKR